jgi:peroxiredoxin-like protein
MSEPHYYVVDISWVDSRKGILSSPVLNNTIEVATPPDFPKGIPGIWSPEHFLVAAANSCLMTTFLAIAENSHFPFVSFHSHAKGKVETVDGKLMLNEIELTPTVVITDLAQQEKAIRILHKAEAACLISNSLKSTVLLHPIVLIQ